VIVVRSPLRISLGGGGTDLPSYYKQFGGFVVSAAIDKYVYISINKRFVSKMLLKYSRLEEVDSVDAIEHPLFRECLRFVNPSSSGIEICSMADIPAGTGLGSSGSFGTALLKALHCYNRSVVHPKELAEQACHIEMEVLGEPIGKQDQYIAAFGGITRFDFNRKGDVSVTPLRLSNETIDHLEHSLILYFTGVTRSASEILKEQDTLCKESSSEMFERLHQIRKIGQDVYSALISGNFRQFSDCLAQHWEAKKQRSSQISNSRIDDLYKFACNHGAIAGKLVGAGGGGFLMFYTEDRSNLRAALVDSGMQEVPFRFDFSGTTSIVG
jgi:D-glycero-alpha-D-manno-heptose-7-phosphate kinase